MKTKIEVLKALSPISGFVLIASGCFMFPLRLSEEGRGGCRINVVKGYETGAGSERGGVNSFCFSPRGRVLKVFYLSLSIYSGPARLAWVPWPCSWLAINHSIQPTTVLWTSTTSVVPPIEISKDDVAMNTAYHKPWKTQLSHLNPFFGLANGLVHVEEK
ncbi:hypothetical protein CROQUDRAFT_85998 [Cronartium quercuum f. sp. fusiforme G11]|uniref:Uncharacterized protein n=1 Tax=Cronartium quercuum f. sp. fusiforme G11 TaxID=708437 RepID=A0A9P6NXK5_9BASI|nr:hypothetical protein CROQUDRAFT_85998 [Cronartium quercuum f. sp. fusiforme G11]